MSLETAGPASVLEVKARQVSAIYTGLAMLAYGGWGVWAIVAGHGFWATWVSAAIFGLGGTYVTLTGLVPVSVATDDDGVKWRQFLYRKTIAWSEMSGIGLGTGKGYVLPVPPGIRESVGINLGRNDGATGAYRRGFSGFDLNIRGDFKPSRQALAEELQRRLELARSRES